ncbi:hypothetical protein BC834DRAFT_475409 [Gloeopeniophorella convolvens]|nr:hypothetical protein BC834DRAFT_475409 [Gloeopeniophorella convolvens]
MVFQFFVLLLTIWNAADRPRPIHVKILSDLIRDGIAANLAIFLLRLCCFALSIPSDTSFFVAGSMLETVFSVTVVSRLVLRVEEMLANNLRSDIVVHVPPMGEGLRSHDFSGVSVITCD